MSKRTLMLCAKCSLELMFCDDDLSINSYVTLCFKCYKTLAPWAKGDYTDEPPKYKKQNTPQDGKKSMDQNDQKSSETEVHHNDPPL